MENFKRNFDYWLFTDFNFNLTSQCCLHQELQQKLNDVAPLLQTAREKGKLLTMMESHAAQTTTMETKLDDLSNKWEELQRKLNDRQEDAEKEREAVAALNKEVKTVWKRLDELAASTEDLTAITYDTAKVLEQRDNYQVLNSWALCHLGQVLILHRI